MTPQLNVLGLGWAVIALVADTCPEKAFSEGHHLFDFLIGALSQFVLAATMSVEAIAFAAAHHMLCDITKVVIDFSPGGSSWRDEGKGFLLPVHLLSLILFWILHPLLFLLVNVLPAGVFQAPGSVVPPY